LSILLVIAAGGRPLADQTPALTPVLELARRFSALRGAQERPGARVLKDRIADNRGKSAAAQIFKLDPLRTPDGLNGVQSRAAWFGVALFEHVDRTLRETDMVAEFNLTPPKNRTCDPQLGGERQAFKPNKFT
jgi:hypothetical protein